MNFIEIGQGDKPSVLFAHGWGRSYHDFIPAAESLGATAKSILVDLPGFGATPRPEGAWGTKDYADHAAAFLRARGDGPIVWVGHSFGGRVGLRLAVQHPDLLKGLVIVGGAGIKGKRSLLARTKGWVRQNQFRFWRAFSHGEAALRALEKRFGSPDYVQSRDLGLRDIFLKTIAEDQSADLARITAPTALLYGEGDTETPPELGQRMAGLIAGAQFTLLPEFDHFSVLFRGHHVIALRTKEMLEGPAAT